jgi:hypothetical protein
LALEALAAQLAALMAGKAAPAHLRAQLQLLLEAAAVVLLVHLLLPVGAAAAVMLRVAMLLGALVARGVACKQKAVVVLVPPAVISPMSSITALAALVAPLWAFLTLVALQLVDLLVVQAAKDITLVFQQAQAVCLLAQMY